MAYITKQQQQEILKQIPAGQDPLKVFQGLIQRGNTLEGYAAPQAATPPPDTGQRLSENQDGFFKSLVKDPIKTLIVKPGTRIAQAGVGAYAAATHNDELFNRTLQDTSVDIPLLGHYNVEGQKSGAAGVRQIAGDALKSAAYLYTPGAVSGAGSTVAKGALTGAKAGALGGGAFGAANALQKDDATLGGLAKDTALGAGLGAVGGAAVGAATAVTTEKLANVARSGVEKEWRDVLNLTNATTNKEAKSGKDIVAKLVQNHMLPDGVSDGRLIVDKTIDQARQHALVGDKLLSATLELEPAQPTANEIYTKALGQLKSTGVPKEQAQQYLQSQLSAFIEQGGSKPTANGELPLSVWNDIKGKAWTNVVDFADPAKTVKNDANNALARAIKETIEKNVENVDVKALNSEIGDWWHVLEVLMDRNGKKVTGRGLTKLVNRGIGAIAGGASGSPAGAIAGSYAADKLSGIITDSTIPIAAKTAFLKRLEGDPETAVVLRQAFEALQKRQGEMVEQLSLPAQSTIFAGPKAEEPAKVFNTPMPPPSMMKPPGWRGKKITDIPRIKKP